MISMVATPIPNMLTGLAMTRKAFEIRNIRTSYARPPLYTKHGELPFIKCKAISFMVYLSVY